ncbi:MAG TPA: uracil-DNA glycosylase [Gammaproteobacteria bacterium]|nr:uracil-DNA glycosylase [Gammaproteobacteria bacterium]
MSDAERLMQRASVHPQWQQILADALATLDPAYLRSLLQDDNWLPGASQLLSAFKRDRLGVRYLLIGESPYPRRESANGIAFYDAAVGALWSAQGLSKPVNRATSLRNIVKTALLAEGHLLKDDEGKVTQAAIAAIDKQPLIQSLDDLFTNLQQAGFLMLNATPVLHPERKPVLEARYWQAFLGRLLASIADQAVAPITLLLWGKIAQQVGSLPASRQYRKLVCEHPYNLSFIDNPQMLELFARTTPLQRR